MCIVHCVQCAVFIVCSSLYLRGGVGDQISHLAIDFLPSMAAILQLQHDDDDDDNDDDDSHDDDDGYRGNFWVSIVFFVFAG